ncbi:MAG: PHP domain-containing protein [Lachnospiraceae bacterium]|nr:PHP domain-containing protein [Lachnospiraceae bacterium]
MKFSYDLHIHSALSPCGDNDMTPNNIVNMAMLQGLDIIAVTDHNSCGNVEAAIKVSEGTGVLVVPGMEAETSEGIHVVCFFPDIKIAMKAHDIIKNRLPGIKNKEKIYGEQFYMDATDEITGKEENLLVVSSDISIYELFDIVSDLGGACVPAHVDRESYSIMAVLGAIPEDLNVNTIEISKNKIPEEYIKENPYIGKYKYITSSDAHYLEDISENTNFIDIPEKTPKAVIKYLKEK